MPEPQKLDTKPTGPRLVRIDTEPDSASRRLDDALRALSKRIEVSEQAQNEALNAVAVEIQRATRDQAQAFARFAERIDRVEKNSDNAPMREAVRGLHHGVARLTDQIAKTTTESASQVSVLATSIEAMALKIASVRDESVRLERVIEERLNALSERVKQMEERVQATPASQQLLESRIDGAERKMREAFAQHVTAVERNFGSIAARLDEAERTRGQGHLQETLATLSRRFEGAERRTRDALATLQSYISDATARIARLETPGASDPSPRPPAVESSVSPPAEIETAAETAPPDLSRPREYLARTRRAAQAGTDSTTGNIWQLPVAGLRERSQTARIFTQAFLLLLVMCTGFLLMQYFGPQPETPPVTKTGAVQSPSAPELRDLELKANEGVTDAELLLGLRYANGEGVETNNIEAAKWLERAAQKGQAIAQYRLGTLYEKGLGVPQNPSTAADWYTKAAERGNVRAMHNLAVAYANGAGRQANYTEAAKWFRSAAEHGLADAQFNLAVLHERGLGVGTSLPDAYRWYAIAAAQGDNESGTRVEALLSQLPAGQRDTADKAAEAFKPMPINAEANEAPPLSRILN